MIPILVLLTLIISMIIPVMASGKENSDSVVPDLRDITNNEIVEGVMDIHISEEETVRVLTEETGVKFEQSNQTNGFKSSAVYTDIGININDIVETSKQLIDEEEFRNSIREYTYTEGNSQGGLLEIDQPDDNYNTRVVTMTPENREILEALVFGEAGGEGFIGTCLVAQAIKDTWVMCGYTDMNELIRDYQYSGSTTNGTNQNAVDAVRYIFDEGGYAVKHRILFFYAFMAIESTFHESQNFIVQYGGHRFFDKWN